MQKSKQPKGWLSPNSAYLNHEDRILESFLKEVAEYPLLGPTTLNQLIVDAQNGDLKARDQVVQSNCRLIVRIAKEFQSKNLSINDLIQEGYLGLNDAIDKFRPSKKVPFPHFASWWIKTRIIKFIWWNQTTIRLPDSQRVGIKKLIKITSKYINEHGVVPSMEELLENSGLSKKMVENYCTLFNYGNFKSYEHIGEIPEEHLPVDSSLSPEDYAQRGILADTMEQCLQILKPVHREFLKDYYGIGRPELTSSEIAKITGKTTENVRQKRARLANYLKSQCSKELETFADEME